MTPDWMTQEASRAAAKLARINRVVKAFAAGTPAAKIYKALLALDKAEHRAPLSHAHRKEQSHE